MLTIPNSLTGRTHYINPRFVAHVICQQAAGHPAGILNVEVHLAGGTRADMGLITQEDFDKFLAELNKGQSEHP